MGIISYLTSRIASKRLAGTQLNTKYTHLQLEEFEPRQLLNVGAGGHVLQSHAPSAWYVSPQGSPTGDGQKDAPWDIASVLAGKHAVAPGDTVWLEAGTYRAPFQDAGLGYSVRLAGTGNAPIHVRAVPGAHVIIDGGLNFEAPSSYVWVQDLEVTVTDPRPAHPVPPSADYKGVKRPLGGVNVNTGTGFKFINLLVHDNGEGFRLFHNTTNTEVYGSIIYDNGWLGTDRPHGPGVYTQNQTGTKVFADSIFAGGYATPFQAYGTSRASVDNYRIEGNIAYGQYWSKLFLIGGASPSHGIDVSGNYLYGLDLGVGYRAPYNIDATVKNNVVVNGSLVVRNYQHAIVQNNLKLPKESTPRPAGALVVLEPNQYDSNRANLVVYNWDKKPTVQVNPGSFLQPGQQYRLLDPRHFWGPPAVAGTYHGGPIQVPVAGEFGAFIILKNAPPTPVQSHTSTDRGTTTPQKTTHLPTPSEGHPNSSSANGGPSATDRALARGLDTIAHFFADFPSYKSWCSWATQAAHNGHALKDSRDRWPNGVINQRPFEQILSGTLRVAGNWTDHLLVQHAL